MDGNATHYKYKGGWRAYEMKRYSLGVKGKAPYDMVVRHSVYVAVACTMACPAAPGEW